MASPRILLMSLCLTSLLPLARPAWAGVSGGETSADQAAEAGRSAPVCPVAEQLPAGAVLVDYIDCAAEPGSRGFADDGRSAATSSPAGPYRRTAINDNAFFAYRFRVGQTGAPHVIVVQYPDDDERTVTVFLHEQKLRGLYNSDFHIEGGYSSGVEYPNTNQMKHMLMYFWPQDQSPAIVCLNEHHFKPAALAKIWVYQITEPLAETPVNTPADLPKRNLGIFFEDSRMFRFNFGLGGGGEENAIRYLKHTGQNLLSYDVVLYSYPKCNVPYLKGRDSQLVAVLNACDKYGVDFVAVFDPTSACKVNGLTTGDLTDPAVIDAWATAVDQFVETYGTHPSLKGISFGGPAGCSRMASDKLAELQRKINANLARRGGKITQHIFFGYKYLHRDFFTEEGFDAETVLADWEASAASGASFRDELAKCIARYYEHVKLRMDDYADLSNVMIHRSFYDNDQRCFQFYPLRLPLSMILRDYTRSDECAALLDGPDTLGACLFGSYFEVTTGLFGSEMSTGPGGVAKNFWWDRTWIASQINPSETYFLESYANALDTDDCTFIMNSSWVNPIIGSPHLVRKFARAFLTLPAYKFDTAARNDYVVARQLRRDGKLWFYLLNNHPSAADVDLAFDANPASLTDLVSGRVFEPGKSLSVTLEPYQLACFVTEADSAPLGELKVRRAGDAHAALKARIDRLGSLIADLQALGATVPQAYVDLRRQTGELFGAGQYSQADDLLAWTPSNWLTLRRWMADGRETFTCRKLAGPVTLDGKLDEWSDAAYVDINQAGQLICDRWLYNWWRDADDLSARIWAAYDDDALYLAFDVRDDVARRFDGISFSFDAENYLTARSAMRPGHGVSVEAPLEEDRIERPGSLVLIKTEDGYRGELRVELNRIGSEITGPGTRFGFHAMLTDMDLDPEIFNTLIKNRRGSWRREKRMEWPLNPHFNAARDCRSCGIMAFE